MSAVAVVITGGYFAYQELSPRFLSKGTAKPPAQSGKTAAGSAGGSAKTPSSADSAAGSETGEAAGSETGEAAGSETGEAAGSETGEAAGSEGQSPPGHKVIELEIPRLTGLTLDQARAELTKLGFDEGVLDAPPDFGCTYDDEKRDIVPVGTICNQQREPGSHLMSNAKVRVVVEHNTYEHGGAESGNEWHRMPNVVGMPLKRARVVLGDLGFREDEFVIGEARSSCGKGVVCEQAPKEETRKFAGRPGELNLGN